MRVNHVLLIGAVALGGYVLGPQTRNYVLPFIGNLRSVNMHLDPDVPPGQIEDRRGEHGGFGRGGPWGDLPGDAGGGDLGRMGPGPRGGPGGGMPPWDEAGSDGPGGGYPGGPSGREGRRDDRLGCWDSVEHHPVDMSFCDRERAGRR